jgi:hypothetical protein
MYYNHEHRHSRIGLHTPASVHFGTHLEIRDPRAATSHLERRLRVQPDPLSSARPERSVDSRNGVDQPTRTGGRRTQLNSTACLSRPERFRDATSAYRRCCDGC